MPDWIAASRDRESTVIRIVKRELSNSAGGEPSGAFEVEQSQLRPLRMDATKWPWLTHR
jgi:hypothetical protein